MAAWLPKFMKKQVLLISVVITALGILEAAALITRPKVELRDGSLGLTPATITRESSFSFEQSVSAASTVEEQVTEEARLNLELVGTAIGNIKDARAFIKDLETGKQGIYKVGNTIQQARITRIAMGEVALESNGKEEILRLSKQGKQWAHVSESDSPITFVSENLYAVNRKELMQETGNVLKTMQKVRVKPYLEKEAIAGLRVEGIPENSLIAAAGIRNSDVVTMINSQKIDSYPKALQVMSKMKGQKEIQISVLRNGQPQQIAYRIQ